jgi:hypothetical protein
LVARTSRGLIGMNVPGDSPGATWLDFAFLAALAQQPLDFECAIDRCRT